MRRSSLPCRRVFDSLEQFNAARFMAAVADEVEEARGPPISAPLCREKFLVVEMDEGKGLIRKSKVIEASTLYLVQ